eukprot:COSAG02_NODE_12371_length_1556_cov_256.960192_1_plen_319_part_00
MSLDAVLNSCADDTLLAIAAALPTCADLLRLALTTRAAAQRFYFTTTCFSSAAAGEDHRASTSPGPAIETWSIVEEAARRKLSEGSDQERQWVPLYGCHLGWLGLLWEREMLRRPLAFRRSHELIALSEAGRRAALTYDDALADDWCTVTTDVTMRAGRHYAQFELSRDADGIMVGVVHRQLNVKTDCAQVVPGCALYHAGDGDCLPHIYPDRQTVVGQTKWEGMQPAKHGDRIGMLLDLDQGSMTVWKNDVRLGVMVASGLSGEYCWAAELCGHGTIVRITPTAGIVHYARGIELPPSPTMGELTRAAQYEPGDNDI